MPGGAGWLEQTGAKGEVFFPPLCEATAQMLFILSLAHIFLVCISHSVLLKPFRREIIEPRVLSQH